MPVDMFGELPDGRPVHRVILGSAPGPQLEVLTLGATVHRLHVTGGDGARRNVVLGHAAPRDYLASGDYIGGTIGRYANRIARGRFVLDGTTVEVGAHDRGNHLHGGPDGFDRRLWQLRDQGPAHALLELVSPDGDQGFPGEVRATVRFDVGGDGVHIAFTATTTKPTVVNLTNHAYFNLDGDGAGTVDDHLLTVAADQYTPTDATGIPLGGHADVGDSPFDLRTPVRLGEVIRSPHDQIAVGKGIDHNYVLAGSGLRTAAVLTSPRTRTRLEIATDQPGLQVYTGNFLDGARLSSRGVRYRQGDGIALEPQLFPDTPNQSYGPSARLAPGEEYRATITWTFGPAGRP